MNFAVSIKNLSHKFADREVLKGLNFVVEKGEIVGVLGLTGSGKSTLLRLCAGLEKVQKGEIYINGRIHADARYSRPPHSRGVGMVLQEPSLFSHLTIRENLQFGVKGKVSDHDKDIRELAGSLGLWKLLDAYPHELSGGQRQWVALARAIIPRPNVLLLDEPFSGIDEISRSGIRGDLFGLVKAWETSVIFVTHDREDAIEVSDRIAVLDGGAIVQTGDAVHLYRNPSNPLIAQIIDPEFNRFKGWVLAGEVSSPVGQMSVGGVEDGTAVDILIRGGGINNK